MNTTHGFVCWQLYYDCRRSLQRWPDATGFLIFLPSGDNPITRDMLALVAIDR